MSGSPQRIPNPRTLPDDELRRLLKQLSTEEADVSQRRAGLHRALDAARGELLARLHDTTAASLSEAIRARSLVHALSEAEAEISARRRRLHRAIDSLHEELLHLLDQRVKRLGAASRDVEGEYRLVDGGEAR